MRLRALHLACLLMLVSALGGVEACALPSPSGAQAQIAQRASVVAMQSVAGSAGKAARVALPVAARERQRTVWAMRPPAEQSSALHAVTGFGL